MESHKLESCEISSKTQVLSTFKHGDEIRKEKPNCLPYVPCVESTKPNSELDKLTKVDIVSLNSSQSLDKIIELVASSIKEIIEINNGTNSTNPKTSQESSPLYSKRIPNITIEAYLQRMVKYTKMEASTLILSSIYVDRFCEKYEYFLTPNTVYR